MSCCSEVVDLGCFDGCDTITLTGYTATQNGDHVFEIYVSNGSVQEVTVSFLIGDTFTITANTLNESRSQDIRIKQPDGVFYEFTTDVECGRLVTQVHL